MEVEMAKMAVTVMRMKQEQDQVAGACINCSTFASEEVMIYVRLLWPQHNLLPEADRMRNSALQGAAFYRAKLFAYEANSTSEASRTKTQLQQLVSEHMAQERKMDELMDSYASHAKLKEQAKDRANDVITPAGFAKKADEKSLT
ncbi:hypothetical protein FRC02_007094 [Tulasnella sp. 418]|nr:hypothetical protein FRC02_007094 [Tulasnella sp. 418]